MELILTILGFACIGHLAADFLSQFEKLWDKPFKCNMCLTYWTSLIPLIFMYEGYGILYAAVASITSEIIYKNI